MLEFGTVDIDCCQNGKNCFDKLVFSVVSVLSVVSSVVSSVESSVVPWFCFVCCCVEFVVIGVMICGSVVDCSEGTKVQ